MVDLSNVKQELGKIWRKLNNILNKNKEQNISALKILFSGFSSITILT